MDSLNANEAEVFALLIGYRELLRFGGYNAILEGDSFSAIQWGFKEGFSSLEASGLGGGGVGYI